MLPRLAPTNGNVISSSPLQPLNAEDPMLVTPSGIVTLVSPLHNFIGGQDLTVQVQIIAMVLILLFPNSSFPVLFVYFWMNDYKAKCNVFPLAPFFSSPVSVTETFS